MVSIPEIPGIKVKKSIQAALHIKEEQPAMIFITCRGCHFGLRGWTGREIVCPNCGVSSLFEIAS